MKSPTARTIGPRGALWIGGLLLLLVPLAFLAPLLGALGLAAAALAGAGLLHRRAAALAASQEKLSSEIDVLSRHLLKVETLARAAAERASAAPAPAAPARPDPGALDRQAIASGLDEVTAEIGLLSGIVRELATVVSTQEGELARLTGDVRQVKADAQAAAQADARAQAQARPRPAVVPETGGHAATPPLRQTPAPRPAPEPAAPAFRPPPFAPSVPDPVGEARIVEAFDGDGIEVWLQPVVTLPQRKVVSYEAVARLRVGARHGGGQGAGQEEDAEAPILAPETFLPVLERHGRTTALDRRMLRSVATIARHLHGRGSTAAVAYGLSPLSLFEPGFLRSLSGLVGDGADLAGRLVVALPQAAWRSLDAEQSAVLAELRGRIGFVLDRPSDLRFDARALAERGVGQIRVPAAMLLRPAPDLLPEIALEDLVPALGRAGLRLVACDVEREADVPDLIDRDVPLAQGGVFASPRAVRTEVFAATPAPTPPDPGPPEPEPEPPQRRPFRDFLRRAV